MDDAKKLAGAVLDLAKAGGAKRTKMGQLRELLPAIEEAHNKGISHEEILKKLNEGGLNLQMGAYTTMLWRARNVKGRKESKAEMPVSPASGATVLTPGKDEAVKQGSSSAATETQKPETGTEGQQGSSTPQKPGELPKFDWDLDTNQKPEW